MEGKTSTRGASRREALEMRTVHIEHGDIYLDVRVRTMQTVVGAFSPTA